MLSSTWTSFLCPPHTHSGGQLITFITSTVKILFKHHSLLRAPEQARFVAAVRRLQGKVCLHSGVIKDNIDELMKGTSRSRHQTLDNDPGAILHWEKSCSGLKKQRRKLKQQQKCRQMLRQPLHAEGETGEETELQVLLVVSSNQLKTCR